MHGNRIEMTIFILGVVHAPAIGFDGGVSCHVTGKRQLRRRCDSQVWRVRNSSHDQNRSNDQKDYADCQYRRTPSPIPRRSSWWRRNLNRLRSIPVHWRKKAIPFAWDRLDVARAIGVVAQDVTNLLDCRVQPVLEVNESAIGPELLAKLPAGDQLAGTLQKSTWKGWSCSLRRTPFLRSSAASATSSKGPKR